MTEYSETSRNSRLRVAILILAAGEGSRLGGFPKALLKKCGQSLLSRLCFAGQSIHAEEILVVTGFFSKQIQEEIRNINQESRIPIEWVNNPHPEIGQSTSVRIGLESLKSDYDVLLVALCDQPMIGVSEINSLLEQFTSRTDGQEIVLPIVNGQRGNPVLFSRRVIQTIINIPEMVCRKYMDEHPDLVRDFASTNQAYIADVDTQDDIQQHGLDSN